MAEEREEHEKRTNVWVWGKPDDREIKHAQNLVPHLNNELTGQRILSVACGGKHMIALGQGGRVFTWGWNWCGQLGHGDRTDRSPATLVKAFALFRALKRTTVIAVAAGAEHSIALSDNGDVHTWGGNEEGQLGRDDYSCELPVMLLGMNGKNACSIASGGTHSLALTKNGDVYSWGRGANGRTGHNSESPCPKAKKIDGLKNIKSIACGWSHSLCISEKGQVYAFGKGSDGQLGMNDPPVDVLVPSMIPQSHFQNVPVVSICGGYYHSAAITAIGSLYTWGWGEHGQLGIDTCDSHFFPTLVNCSSLSCSDGATKKPEKEAVCVGAGAFHTCIATRDGSVLTCGLGEHGQLGQGSNHSRSRPAPIEPFSERSFLDPTNYFHLGDVIAITCGWWYTILVTDHTHLGEKVEKKIEEMYSEGWGVERRRERGKKCGGEDGKYQLAKEYSYDEGSFFNDQEVESDPNAKVDQNAFEYNFEGSDGNTGDSIRHRFRVEIATNRTYLGKRYQNCFIGKQAVDWIVENAKVTVDEAVGLARSWEEKGDFGHIFSAYKFKNEYLFYQFLAPPSPQIKSFSDVFGQTTTTTSPAKKGPPPKLRRLKQSSSLKTLVLQSQLSFSESSVSETRREFLSASTDISASQGQSLRPSPRTKATLRISPTTNHRQNRSNSSEFSQALVDHHAVHHPKESFSLNSRESENSPPLSLPSSSQKDTSPQKDQSSTPSTKVMAQKPLTPSSSYSPPNHPMSPKTKAKQAKNQKIRGVSPPPPLAGIRHSPTPRRCSPRISPRSLSPSRSPRTPPPSPTPSSTSTPSPTPSSPSPSPQTPPSSPPPPLRTRGLHTPPRNIHPHPPSHQQQQATPASQQTLPLPQQQQQQQHVTTPAPQQTPPPSSQQAPSPQLPGIGLWVGELNVPSGQTRNVLGRVASFFSDAFADKPERDTKKWEMQQRQLANVWTSDILPDWDKKSSFPSEHRKIWRTGIPASIRGEAWKRAIGNRLEITPEIFAAVSQLSKERRAQLEEEAGSALRQSNLHTIEVDIPRTFPALGVFQKGGPLHEPLKDILEAYNTYRSDIGYVQGMSHLGAILLMYLDTNTAFTCLTNLLGNPFFESLFRMELRELLRYFEVYEMLFHANLPNLYKHFKSLNITAEQYLLDWFCTIFTRAIPLFVACRVWDSFVFEGEMFLFRAALGILNYHKKLLRRTSFEQCVLSLRQLPTTLDEETLFSAIFSLQIPKSISEAMIEISTSLRASLTPG